MFISKQEYLCASRMLQVTKEECKRLYGRNTPNDNPVPFITFEQIRNKYVYFQSPILLDLVEHKFCDKSSSGVTIKRMYANMSTSDFVRDYYVK